MRVRPRSASPDPDAPRGLLRFGSECAAVLLSRSAVRSNGDVFTEARYRLFERGSRAKSRAGVLSIDPSSR